MQIAIVAKYFGYGVGGAERSVVEYLKKLERRGASITAYVASNVRTLNAQSLKMDLPESWDIRLYKLRIDQTRFRYIDYYVNRPVLERLSKECEADVMCAYGLYAPATLNSFEKQTRYLARDEYALGWNINYYRGFRGVAQSCYHLIDSPLRRLWLGELWSCIRKSELVANSSFLARHLQTISPASKLDIELPHIDVDRLKEEYERHRCNPGVRGIVAVGNGVLKGGDIVWKIARKMPSETFIVFDRSFAREWRSRNVVCMPWKSAGEVYAHAEMMLVPSRWHESYPRVIIEAQSLGIPVVASDRGGIPEAIDKPDRLIHDLENIDCWVDKISSNSRIGCASKP